MDLIQIATKVKHNIVFMYLNCDGIILYCWIMVT